MRFVALLIVALATLVSSAQAQQADPATVAHLWRRIGPWGVWVVRVNFNCYVSSEGSGPEIYVGFDKKHKLGVGLTHEAWRSLEVGKKYPMTIQIDDRQHFGVMDSWLRPNGKSVVLGRDFDDEEQGRRFVQDFQRGSQLTVIYEGRRLASYVLQASQMAGDELMRCQAAQDKLAGDRGDDPFKPRGSAAADKPAPDKSGPSRDGGAATPSTFPKLTPDQRVDAVRLAANLLTRLQGFRILNEEEQKAVDPKMAALEAAVVWRTDGALGMLHMFPNVTEAQLPKIAGMLLGGIAEDCSRDFTGAIAPDVRSANVRRVHASCARGDSGTVMRVILMPFKGGVYYFSTAGNLKDNDAVVRAEEQLRNALFEVMPK